MFKKVIVIDGKGHMMGRLASYVAKHLLSGQKIVVVRCEAINISGSLFRNKVRFSEFLRKRLLTNPRRTFVHYRAPSRMLWRSIRGMINHKISRGAAALGRLKVFEGCPAPYDTMKKQVVPDALRCVKLSSFRKYCVLGDLSSEVGWGKRQLVNELEAKRKQRAANWHKQRAEKVKAAKKTQNTEEIKKLRSQLAQYGY